MEECADNHTLISLDVVLDFNSLTGAIVETKIGGDEYYRCIENISAQKKEPDEELMLEILSQLCHFKNCDFTGAEYLDKDHKELLRRIGAIVD